MTEQVKIGFIGCGGNARGHMKALNNMEDAKIVAVCDLKEELAASAAALCDADAYTNHRVMLDKEDLDAAYISIPVFAHGAPELDVIERGLPFFVEKPVAINMETARKIYEAVEENGITTCVGYQLRYLGATDASIEILRGKKINMVVGKYWCGTGRGDPHSWLRKMDKSGGQILEQATHTIDMMRYLAGEIKEVFAMQENRALKEIDCPDVNSICVRFESGAIGSVTAAWTHDPEDWSNANVLDVLYEASLLHWTSDGIALKPEPETPLVMEAGQHIDRVFADAVKTGDATKIRSPYDDAVKSLAVSLAINRSGKSGKMEAVSK